MFANGASDRVSCPATRPRSSASKARDSTPGRVWIELSHALRREYLQLAADKHNTGDPSRVITAGRASCTERARWPIQGQEGLRG